jgi:hypothetical protein
MENRFHCSVNGQSCGPYTLLELHGYLQASQLTASTLVWDSAINQWVLIQHFMQNHTLPINPAQPPLLPGSQFQPTHTQQPAYANPANLPLQTGRSPQADQSAGAQNCPHGHGPLQDRNGNLRCSICGWPNETPIETDSEFEVDSEVNDGESALGGAGSVLGVCCYIFAVIDFMGMFLGYDLTGVSWSPIAAGFLGGILMEL